MSVENKVEETTNADGLQSSQPIAKPNVVCSQSLDFELFENLLKRLNIDYEKKDAIVIKQPSAQGCLKELSDFLKTERQLTQYGNVRIKNGVDCEIFLILDE